jgi:hypothetical protein
VSTVEGSVNSLNSASSSYALQANISGAFTSVSASFASDRLLNTTDTLDGDLTVTGKITAQEFHTEFVSASIIYQSGSTKFGDSIDDNHQITGSLQVSGSSHYLLGNVGIGTTSPSKKLHVNGAYYLAGFGPDYISYTPDGLFSSNALPSFIGSGGYGGTYGRYQSGGGGLILGYKDNGSGLYSPAYGFEVKSVDGANNANRVVRAIVIKDIDTNEEPFWINNNGAAYFKNNVGIGTTSPVAVLTTENTGAVTFNSNDGDHSGFGLFIKMPTTPNTVNSAIGFGGVGGRKYAAIAAQTYADRDQVGLNFYVQPTATGSTAVLNEAMRITSGGEVLIGTTTTSSTSGVGSKFTPNGRLRQVSSYVANDRESLSMYSTGASAYRFYVGWGGTVFATNTSISAISDARLKENIQDLSGGLDAVLSLRPRTYDWKEDSGQTGIGVRGFIAQEVEEVFPEYVDEYKTDKVPEDGIPYKSVRQDFIPILVKAIQELKAEIDQLKEQLNSQ